MIARMLAPLALMTALGCAANFYESTPRSCSTDAECGTGQICFAEGCGDPGSGLVVEVAGNGATNQFARDFAIADGTLTPTYDFQVGAPLTIIGEFQRELGGKPDPANRTAYIEPVRLQAVGESELIPGVTRLFEQRIDQPVRGTYQMLVGTGVFTVTATPLDSSIPPSQVTGVVVRSGIEAPQVDFAFPAIDGAITLSGRLLKRIDSSSVPVQEIALTESRSAMDLQAFEPDTMAPLSQRFPVSSGQPGATGNFTMTLDARAKDLKAFTLVATPREAGSPMPTKRFTITTPLSSTLTLELGDPGPAVTVRGVAVDRDEVPIAQAQVVLEGSVNGGGTFRSKIAITDSSGAFTLEALSGPMTATVVPPAGVLAGVTSQALTVSSGSKPTVMCRNRVTLSGVVTQPDGTPAVAVSVRATERPAASTAMNGVSPLPLDSVETVTDDTGAFTLRVDPSTWRLDFYPKTRYPLASRLVTVEPALEAGYVQALKAHVALSTGRTVQGVVSGMLAASAPSVLPYATLRFFRVAPIKGVSTATLVGTAITDEKGRYQVVLPANAE